MSTFIKTLNYVTFTSSLLALGSLVLTQLFFSGDEQYLIITFLFVQYLLNALLHLDLFFLKIVGFSPLNNSVWKFIGTTAKTKKEAWVNTLTLRSNHQSSFCFQNLGISERKKRKHQSVPKSYHVQ